MMLMAITNHVCQDVAVVPFFWVVPLSLYLLSFIICFDREIWYRRRIFSLLLVAGVFALCLLLMEEDLEDLLEKYYRQMDLFEFMDNLFVEAGIYLLVLFLLCMVCHGELVRVKPRSRYLTEFYLMVSCGGRLGRDLRRFDLPAGLLQLRRDEYRADHGLHVGHGRVLGRALAKLVVARTVAQVPDVRAGIRLADGGGPAQFVGHSSSTKLTLRNFYGVLTISEQYEDDSESHTRKLLNGRILHGEQFLDPLKRRTPITYYNHSSGIGMTLLNCRRDRPLRVAVVGLGTGTIAAYGNAGDYFCFYEINPNVLKIAGKYFNYLSDCPAEVHVELGDARLSMERQSPALRRDRAGRLQQRRDPRAFIDAGVFPTVLPPFEPRWSDCRAHQQSPP